MTIIQTFFGGIGNSDHMFKPLIEWQSFIHGRRFVAERVKRFGGCRLTAGIPKALAASATTIRFQSDGHWAGATRPGLVNRLAFEYTPC